MAQPTEYTRRFDFTQHAAQNPGEPPPGAKLDEEFNALKLHADQSDALLDAITRDDGLLANGLVKLQALAQETIDFILSNGGSGAPSTGGDGGDGGGTPTPTPTTGVVFFKQLGDTPKSYVGQKGKILKVKASEDGLEFGNMPTPAVSFLGLTDSPDSYAGNASKFVRVSATGAFLEFVAINVAPGHSYARLDAANDFAYQEQRKAKLVGYAEKEKALGDVSGAITIDLAAETIISAKAIGPVQWLLSNLPPAGDVRSFTLYLTNGGAHAQTWPAGIAWNESPLTLAADGENVLTFTVRAAGAKIYGFKAG